MSICAIIPVASLSAANAALEAQGFGIGNFSVPAYGATGATHAALHAWDDPPFNAAVKAIAGVVYAEGTGDPVARTKALIEAQGAQWGAQLPELPSTGTLPVNAMYRWNGDILIVLQPLNRTTYPADPSTYSALIARVHEPGERRQWKQPGYAFDTYRLVNPFSGKADETEHGGKLWRTKVDNNVWEPAVGALWDEIDADGNVIVPVAPPVEEWPAWKPWTGINADLYQVGAKVSHAGKRWINATANSHWKPGTYGWTQQP